MKRTPKQMMNKLIPNERILNFLDDEYKQIWNFIIEGDIPALLESLPEEEVNLHKIIRELFTEGQSETLNEYDFSVIRDGNNTHVRDLVKLIFALNINGSYDEINNTVGNKLLNELPLFIEKVQDEAVGYPMRKVHDVILNEAASTRALLISLILCYRETDDIESLHATVMMRTKLTLAIMGRQKHVLGFDMIETAKVKELIGEQDAALSFYNAARDNLKDELQWFVESPEMGPDEDDIVMLQALKEAYLSIDRLNNVTESEKACALIDEILSREYIDVFADFDEDEDED